MGTLELGFSQTDNADRLPIPKSFRTPLNYESNRINNELPFLHRRAQLRDNRCRRLVGRAV
jgi:hypothetical protein